MGVPAKNAEARRFLGRYVKKSPVMNPRIELVESVDEPIVRVHKFTDDGSQSRDFEPLSFLAELSQHIPNMWEQTTRYVGCYSARTRGAKRSQLEFAGELPELEPAEKPSSYWAQCLKPILKPGCEALTYILEKLRAREGQKKGSD